MSIRHTGLLSGASLLVIAQICGAYSASAQDVGTSSGQTASSDNIEEVVVTGTLIRNVIPAGSLPITLDAAAIQATGAVSTDQLLATIPQLNSFDKLQTGNSGGTALTVNPVNLRALPQGGGASSPTLLLLDGHRMVSEGVKQAYPDPDVIPADLIERVEVVPDGGSATYGSDAVGGVINFITKKDFNGVDVGVHQAIGDAYSGTDANVTAGTSWSTGSAYIGYDYAIHGSVFGSDRDYIKSINYTTGLPTGLSCSPANVQIGGTTGPVYAVNGGNSLSLSNANLCDTSQNGAFYPDEVRNSVMVGFRQELTNSIEFSLKGYYSNRDDTQPNGFLGGNSQVKLGNPNYISTGDANGAATQTVFFNFEPEGARELIKTKLWSYGITPTLTWDFGHDWEAVAFYNYGQSQTTANDPQFNQTVLNSDVKAGTINPYSIATSNAGELAKVLDYTDYGIGKDTLSNAKVTFDGPLFSLPGGELRAAVGGEYIAEGFRGTVLTDTPYENIAAASLASGKREVEAGFGELNIPVIGPDNNVPLVNSLTIAASERYDHYSDFGGNWAPNLGATLKPVDWISLRGRWNKSFQAPSLVTLSQAASPQTNIFSGAIVTALPALQNPAVPPNGGPIVAIQGTLSPLQPQKARDYDLGFDISPPIVDGLNLHFTYWNIQYAGQIDAPPLGFGQFYGIASYNNLYEMLPTNAQVQAFLTKAGIPAAQIANAIAQVNAGGVPAYIVVDVRARNLGLSNYNGFDFGFDYHHDVSFGTVYGSFGGTYNDRAITSPDGITFGPNQAGVDGFPHFTFVSTAGATIGDNIRAQVTWNHRGGTTLSAPAQLNQTTVAAFDTFDLYTEYDLKRSDLPPLSFSLGVTNLFDANPPLYRDGVGYYTLGGTTLGRVFQLGVSVKM